MTPSLPYTREELLTEPMPKGPGYGGRRPDDGQYAANEADKGNAAADSDVASRQDDTYHQVEEAAAVEFKAQANGRFIG